MNLQPDRLAPLSAQERADLKITDMRFCDIDGMPKRCTLIKLYTNADIVGYGEVRDAATKTYAAMLKSRLLGENPLNVDKLFRRVKQFGHHSRQGGGVSGVEVALWDIAGKAWGVPCWQLLGGKFRDRIRVYCDTDVEGKHTGHDMGLALKRRMDMGFTFLKMDLGIGLLIDEPGTLTAPLGFLQEMKTYGKHSVNAPHGSMEISQMGHKAYEINTIGHPFTGIRITEKGLNLLEDYVREVREVIGYDVPLAVDHFGHICVEDTIRFARRMEPYNLAWIEDVAPWHYTDHYVRLRNATTVPICTGEDIYCLSGSVSVFPAQSGTLGERIQLVEHTGSGPNPDRQEAPHAHQCVFRPGTNELFVCDLGSDRVRIYDQNPDTGLLSHGREIVMPAGMGPRHLVFADADHFYVTGELDNVVRRVVHGGGWKIDGALSTLPPDFSGESATAAIRLRDGALWVSNRGHDSLCRIDLDGDGRMLGASWIPTGGRTPRDFAFAPAGLLVAHQDGGGVVASDGASLPMDGVVCVCSAP